MAGPVDFARSSHSTRALVDRRVTDASNPKDLQAGLTVEQVQFVKAYVVDALLVRGIEPPLLLSGSDAFTHRMLPQPAETGASFRCSERCAL